MSSTPASSTTATLGAETRPRAHAAPSARFYVCVATLLLFAIGMKVAEVTLGHALVKKAVPLKKSLAQADTTRLAPDYVMHPRRPPLLSADETDSLGTTEYLRWVLVDTSKSPGDLDRLAHVFVSYYTGQPDMVPHVPDECYLAGGYSLVTAPFTRTVKVGGIEAAGDEIPVRVAEFQGRESLMGGTSTTTVLYFFHTNGDYCATRDQVRFKLANPWVGHAYYAKFEVRFSDDSGVRGPDAEKSAAALARLLPRLMPVFLEDHLAWKDVTGGAAAGQASGVESEHGAKASK